MSSKRLRLKIDSLLYKVKLWLRDIRERYFLKRRHPVMTPYGFQLLGTNLSHHVKMQMGSFEQDEIPVFKKLFAEAGVFIDIGANIGFYTCMARSSSLKVLAFEPSAKNLQLLMQNVLINAWNDVEIFPMALADEPGVATLFGGSSTGASLIPKWAGTVQAFQETVAVSTLDTVLGRRFEREKIFIKIDAEGGEYKVVKGALATLKREVKPTWLIEVCLNEYHPSGLNPHYVELFKTFVDSGYEVRTADLRFEPISLDSVLKWHAQKKCDSGTINYLFSPVKLS